MTSAHCRPACLLAHHIISTSNRDSCGADFCSTIHKTAAMQRESTGCREATAVRIPRYPDRAAARIPDAEQISARRARWHFDAGYSTVRKTAAMCGCADARILRCPDRAAAWIPDRPGAASYARIGHDCMGVDAEWNWMHSRQPASMYDASIRPCIDPSAYISTSEMVGASPGRCRRDRCDIRHTTSEHGNPGIIEHRPRIHSSTDPDHRPPTTNHRPPTTARFNAMLASRTSGVCVFLPSGGIFWASAQAQGGSQ
ncbi:hypothetical protein C8R44DRAFT_852517 [Mycena epipterygia]|nr:hypothetical protein C8R44DRAFT_852517 [Mycena epipterygia]